MVRKCQIVLLGNESECLLSMIHRPSNPRDVNETKN